MAKTRNLLKDNWPQYLLAFLFPFLTVISALAILECYPFGDRTMLTVDLYHQYAPFLVAFRNKLLSGESLFYTWNDGLGTEYYAAFANYTSSPLNLFSIFFDAKTMPVFIGLVTAVRAGLGSLFMTMFLKENDGGRIDNITVVFAASYALCGWFVTDFWNIMWCDALVLLPLVCLGLRKLFVNNNWTLYPIALGITILSNYYAGFFVCLFLVLFAPAYYFMIYSPEGGADGKLKLGFKTFGISAGKFAAASALGGSLSAFIALPTYAILQNASATGDEFPKDFNLTGSLFDFLGRLLVAANPNIRDGMANVFCGVVVLLMLPLFFMLPKISGISLRHKISFAVLLLIMYLSFTNRTLNFIWHGFHFPNQIPYRESFIMPFLLVFMAFLTIRRIKSLTRGQLAASIGGYAVFLVLFEKFGEGTEGYLQIGLSLLFLIVQGIVLNVILQGKKSPLFCETVITVTMLVEIFVASTVTMGMVAKHEGFTNYDFYGKNYKEIHAYTQEVEGTEGHLPFERTELFPNNICCLQSLYDVKGMSIFSSTARESFVRYMRNYGFHNNNINGLRNPGLTKVTATLLGVRNLVTIENTESVPAGFVVEREDINSTGVMAYGNPDALAVGYMVNPSVLDYAPEYEEERDAFLKTNQWVRSMGVDADVYTPINMVENGCENMSVGTNTGSLITYTVLTPDTTANLRLIIDNAPIGSEVYVYASSSKGGTCGITNQYRSYSFEIRSFQIIPLGVFDGTPIEATLTYHSAPTGAINVYGYALNYDGYNVMLDTLGDEQFEISSYDSTTLNGTITANEDGLLMLTIPYSEGWQATVDGKKTEVISIGDALTALRIDKGTHSVVVKYVPQYFPQGITLTIVAAVVLLFISKFSFIRSKAPVIMNSIFDSKSDSDTNNGAEDNGKDKDEDNQTSPETDKTV